MVAFPTPIGFARMMREIAAGIGDFAVVNYRLAPLAAPAPPGP